VRELDAPAEGHRQPRPRGPAVPREWLVHPSWVGNHCGVAFVDSDLPDNADVYKVRALAIRGLEANGHAKLTIKANHGDVFCF
jgi:hypothetical protein